MKKTNIGIFILSNSWGGAEESTSNLIENIDKHQFDVTVFANDFLIQQYSSIQGVRMVNVGSYFSFNAVLKAFSLLKIQHKLKKEIQENEISVIHARLENALIAMGTMVPKLDIPIVFTLSGDETRIYSRPKTPEHLLIRKSLDTLFRRDDSQVTSVSQWLIKDLPKSVQQKIQVIHNGVNGTLFRQVKSHDPQIKSVLYVGRLVEKKGIEELLAVAVQLPQYEFRFAGKGPLQELITLPNTKLLGFVSRNELVQVYADATICAFPSHAEGMPMVGLEAMACGKAVVASVAGYSEYIENNKDGIIIEPGNIEQIKQAVELLLEDEDKRLEMEQAALKKAAHYDIARTVKRYEDLYLRMAKR